MLRFLIVSIAITQFNASGQGWFDFSNPTAPTRIGTIDGPLAGRGIWAQMLAGPTVDSLLVVGTPAEHFGMGYVAGGVVQVPGIPAGSTSMVQMVAWDGQVWGTSLAGVPADQLGRTDVVPVWLTEPPPGVTFSPLFTQPAIVPVPEPSVWALGALGAGLLLWHRRRTRTRRGLGPAHALADSPRGCGVRQSSAALGRLLCILR